MMKNRRGKGKSFFITYAYTCTFLMGKFNFFSLQVKFIAKTGWGTKIAFSVVPKLLELIRNLNGIYFSALLRPSVSGL